MSSWFDKWITELGAVLYGNAYWMWLGLHWTIAIFLPEDPSVSLISTLWVQNCKPASAKPSSKSRNLFQKQPVKLACLTSFAEKSCLTYAIVITWAKMSGWEALATVHEKKCFNVNLSLGFDTWFVALAFFSPVRVKVFRQKCKSFLLTATCFYDSIFPLTWVFILMQLRQ